MRTYTQRVAGVGMLDDDDVRAIIEKLAEVGSARRVSDTRGLTEWIEFTVEAPNDWELALAVVDVRDMLSSHFSIDFDPDFENVSGDDGSALANHPDLVLALALTQLHADHAGRCPGPGHVYPDECPVFKAWDARRGQS